MLVRCLQSPYINEKSPSVDKHFRILRCLRLVHPFVRYNICFLISLILLTSVLPLAIYADESDSVFVTTKGEVIMGQVIIRTEDSLVIRTPGGRRTLKISDLKKLPEKELQIIGKLADAESFILKGDVSIRQNKYVEADILFRKAILILDKISDDKAGNKLEKKQSLAAQAKLKLESLNNILAEKKLIIYEGFVLDAKELEQNLLSGNIIFRGKYWIKPEQLCDKCNSEGILVCPECKGLGVRSRECLYCQNGKIPCKHCESTGAISCLRCKGDGSIITGCHTCRGSGSIRCSQCGGTGEISKECRSCKGRGRIRHIIRIRDSEGNRDYQYVWIPCSYCNGRGEVERICPGCHGAGLKTCVKCQGKGTISRACRDDGSGIPHCNGTGRIACPSCKGKGILLCRHCDGKGLIYVKCLNCVGKGNILCTSCNGKGYTGDPCGLVTRKFK